MKVRSLGSTKIKVSPIGLGLAALGRPAYINLEHDADLSQNYDIAAMEQRTHQMLDLALSYGINYFDAARSYGKAEEFLGNWLVKRKPKNVIFGSKWGYAYTADWKIDAEHHEIKEHSLPVLQKQWQESKTALKGFPNIYQIHSATFESGVLKNKMVLRELANMKSEGILIGITVSGDQQSEILKEALEIELDGKRLFETIQATYNLLEPSTGAILAQARNEGLGIIIKEGVANGRLTQKNKETTFSNKKQLLEKVALEQSVGIDSIALVTILHQPWVDIVLSGASTEQQLESNINALKVDLSHDMVDELISFIQESPQEYWKRRKALKWN